MSDPWMPDWVDERPGFIELPDDAKDEFHQRIFDHLQDSYGWGYSSQTLDPAGDRPFRITELIANTDSGVHESRLWVANAVGGLCCWTVGAGKEVDRECDLWVSAVRAALSTLGSRSPQTWRAFVAQMPASPMMRFGLLDDVHFGCLSLKQVGTITSEYMTELAGSVATEHFSALIQVDGETDCWAWHGDGQPAASRTLRVLAAMLSLVWDTPWYLRDGPSDVLGANWIGAAGPVSGPLYRWSQDLADTMSPPRVGLPGWFGDAVSASDKDLALLPAKRALLMHHEGLLVAREHPSLALLAFVASIESLASTSKKQLERCPSCRTVLGSTARFRKAVGLVLPANEAEELTRAYDRRSRTVHDAQLHGREELSGSWGPMSLYAPPESLIFEMSMVRLAQKASRTSIWQALGLPGDPIDPLHAVP